MPYKLTNYLLLLSVSFISLFAYQDEGDSPNQEVYRLSVSDTLDIEVFNEPDLSLMSKIDRTGKARLKLLGDVKIANLTLNKAEEVIEQEYITQRYLRNPLVRITVVEYVPREVMILGEANRPGPFQFPNEVKAIGIVELISRIGGFNDLASKKAVKVTRYIQEGGQTIKKVFTVNVKELMAGISSDNADKKFWVYPDDIIYIPERFL